MRKFFLLALSFVLSLPAFSQTDDGILFEISGNGLKAPSYILGSNHNISGEFVHQIPKFDDIFNKVKQTCFETDLSPEADKASEARLQKVAEQRKAEQAQMNMTDLLLPGDSTYSHIIGQEKANQIDSVMSGVLNMSVGTIRPWYLQTIVKSLLASKQMEVKQGQQTLSSIDFYVHDQSVKDGKKIAFLEPRELQDSLLILMTGRKPEKGVLKDDMLKLWVSVMRYGHNAEAGQEVNKLYKSGHGKASVDVLVKVSADTDDAIKKVVPGYTPKEDNVMDVKDRNVLWMKELPRIMSSEPTLVVVGVAHLFPYRGSEGILHDLEAKGYTVKAVK